MAPTIPTQGAVRAINFCYHIEVDSTSVSKHRVWLWPFIIIGLLVLGMGAAVWWLGTVQENQALKAELTKTRKLVGIPTALPADQVPLPQESELLDGSLAAPIYLVEYSDLECPYCKLFHQTVKQLQAQYPGKILHVFRNFPLASHQNANLESETALCVGRTAGSGAYYSFIDLVFSSTLSNGKSFTTDQLNSLVSKSGANLDQVASCLTAQSQRSQLSQEMADAKAVGISGTPSFVIKNQTGSWKLYKGAQTFDSLKLIIDSLL